MGVAFLSVLIRPSTLMICCPIPFIVVGMLVPANAPRRSRRMCGLATSSKRESPETSACPSNLNMTSPTPTRPVRLGAGDRHMYDACRRELFPIFADPPRPLHWHGMTSPCSPRHLALEAQDFENTADEDLEKSARVVIINGAMGGRAVLTWAYDGSTS